MNTLTAWGGEAGMIRRLVATAALAMLVSGCAWLRPDAPEQVRVPVDMPGQLEPIHAAAFTKDLAVFWVSSNGCTDKDDLQPVVSSEGKGGSIITLRRLEEDRCDRPMADGVELQWSFEELGLKPGASVAVNNPYMMPQS